MTIRAAYGGAPEAERLRAIHEVETPASPDPYALNPAAADYIRKALHVVAGCAYFRCPPWCPCECHQ